ncbi:MAG: molybdopterin converting factor subunit 1 [Armatimonadota bacterium]
MIRITVQLFAGVREAAGADELAVELPGGATVEDLRRVLAERVPPLSRILPSCVVAVNKRYASGAVPLSDGDEAALIPPVSGG